MKGSATLLRTPTLALVAVLIASGAMSSAVSATASTEQVFWTTVTQVSGVAGQSMSAKAVAMRSGVPIVAGQFKGVATFPTGPSTSLTLTDDSTTVFVSAMSPGGDYFEWVTPIAGTGPVGQVAAVNSVAVTADDTIYVGGQVYGTVYFPTGRPAPDDSIAVVPADTNQSAFLAAIPAGSQYFAWVQLVRKSGGSSSVASVSVNSDGAPVVTGFSSGTAYFPTGRPAPDDSIALSGEKIYVAAMNADDSYFEWVQPISKGYAGDATSIAITDDDTTLITGYFARSLTFPTGPSASVTLTSDDTNDLFIAAISADDSYFAWAQRAGDDSVVGSGASRANSIAIAPDGAPVIAGTFSGTAYFATGRPAPDDSMAVTSTGSNDVFVAAMNGDDSTFAWVQHAGGTGSDTASAVTINASGQPIVTGSFNGTAYFPVGIGDDPLTLTSAGDRDAFVAALTAGGSGFTWAQRAGGAGSDSASAVVVAPNGRPFVGGTIAGTASFPTGASSSIELTAVGTSNLFTGFLAAPASPNPPAPVPATPSSEPLSVAASAGDRSATISWSSPASSGSFPVSHFLAISTPGAHTCLVAAPALTCEVVGLTNGTAYTFRMKALTGAGWSGESEPSDVVAPRASAGPSIVITGSREGKRIEVSGTTTGFGMGAILNPWVRLAGQTAYSQGNAQVLVSMDGTFAWGRTTGKKISVYMQTPGGSVRSNTVTIR